MAVSDTQFRIAVLAGGALLVAVIIGVRFCGELSLPPKPAPSAEPTGTESQLLAKSTTSPSVYRDFLEHDAALAGVRAPTIEEMSRKLAYHIDEPSHGIALAPGKPPIELAGLRLHIERKDDTVVLAIQNLLDADVAYEVVTRGPERVHAGRRAADRCDRAREGRDRAAHRVRLVRRHHDRRDQGRDHGGAAAVELVPEPAAAARARRRGAGRARASRQRSVLAGDARGGANRDRAG